MLIFRGHCATNLLREIAKRARESFTFCRSDLVVGFGVCPRRFGAAGVGDEIGGEVVGVISVNRGGLFYFGAAR